MVNIQNIFFCYVVFRRNTIFNMHTTILSYSIGGFSFMKIVTYYLFYVCVEHASCHMMTFDAYARVTNPNTAISIDCQHDIMGKSKSVSSLSLSLGRTRVCMRGACICSQ